MWDKQFLCQGLSFFNLKRFCYSYAWSCSLCERRTYFCTLLISRKLCGFLFLTGFTSPSVLLLFHLLITFIIMHGFWFYSCLKELYSNSTDLSMNILGMGYKLQVQRSFFNNSVGDLLPALSFLGGLYDFSNFVIIFLECKSQWYVEEQHISQTQKWLNTTQNMYSWNSRYKKTKNYVRNYTRCSMQKIIVYGLRWVIWLIRIKISKKERIVKFNHVL